MPPPLLQRVVNHPAFREVVQEPGGGVRVRLKPGWRWSGSTNGDAIVWENLGVAATAMSRAKQVPDGEAAVILPQAKESCGNCRFRVERWADQNECRRHAPRLLPGEGANAGWPFVQLTEWCGEWQGKANG